ncbi:MAG: NAD(P)/FAD-dependent oxidoreductase [Desulfovibrio sp.]|uniref:NAD(P)/FAD-dependent oxidoreductase n=1 Tax=Desulfovibrio sp. 7SRBS1 TaxID=3378064 RepID=UPI003B3D082B
MSQFDYDAIVVGAGPAGSSAASALAGEGLRVAVFDRDRFPRSKPCAGAVSLQCLRWLEHDLPPELIHREFYGGLLCFEDSRLEIQHDYMAGVLVRRSEFDAHLLSRAVQKGAVAHTGTPVLDAGDKGDHVLVHTAEGDFRARYLIVAEGASGRLKQLVRPAATPDQVMFCLCGEVPEVEDTGMRPGPLSSRAPLVLHFGLCRMGYGWIFGQPGRVSVGIGDKMSTFAEPRKVLSDFLSGHGVKLPDKLYGHKIPLGGFRRPVAEGRVLLAGDAGGFTDAMLGEGIGYAVRSGQIAAGCVAESVLHGGDTGTAARYTKIVGREIGRALGHSLLLARAMEWMPRWLLRAVLTDSAALSRYIDILADRVSYANFNFWLVRRFPLYLLQTACRALRSK